MDFRSDNVAGAHPDILAALVAANHGAASAYGADPWSEGLAAKFSELFERQVEVFPVATGTAANALALALCTPPWGAIYCHPHAHIQVSECGAPEQFTGGAKLVSVHKTEDQRDGKISSLAVARTIHREGAVHAVQPAAISVSQASEVGSVYTSAELGALAETAKKHGMALHVDGARFANAVAHLGQSPAELSWKVGVDVLSFGATKNGCLTAEAVLLFDGTRAQELGFRRKRAGHLLSKMRYVSAQLEAYLHGELWLHNARHANAQAARLAAGFARQGITLCSDVQTNQVFVELSEPHAARLRARGFQFYDWPTLGSSARRFVTAFDTSTETVDSLLGALSRES